ncbi:MAG: DEAD/DEAH box helicase [Methanomicrobiales archaeon]|nr:DEAD/DEAH box helicase [Methanomicrobiales archaeon]
MALKDFIETLTSNPGFSDCIAHVESYPSKAGVKGTLARPLHPLLQEYLDMKGIELYRHQCEAIDALREGRHTIITTGTASGKTLAFTLPVFERILDVPSTRALFVYPAKALANDQLKAIQEIERYTGCMSKSAVYDGDTAQSKRAGIRNESSIVLTNPYELHHILPWHHRWGNFFRDLAFVVIDEAHRYRGVFGSNTALLIRRLRRICAHYGAAPTFVLSSATLANPLEFARKLTSLDFFSVDQDVSPRSERHFVLFNPYRNGSGSRNTYTAAKDLLVSSIGSGLQTLCFTSSRRMSELVARWALEDAARQKGTCGGSISCYRAGYLPEERRSLEEMLKRGMLRGLVSTNALELGIDIGTLDAVIMCGFPGTLISTWQQAGRAGRRGKGSISILVAYENPLDQYFMNHPSSFFGRPAEHAILDEGNPYILSGHILCAASELPLDIPRDRHYLGNGLEESVLALAGEGLLRQSSHGWVYAGRGRATEAVSLESIASEHFGVLCEGRIIETMDRMQAFREAHPGAVLLHRGDTYLVQSLDLEERVIRVRRAEVDYHTEVVKRSDLRVREERERVMHGEFAISYGDVEVEESYVAYRIIQRGSVVKTEPLDLPAVRFETRACWLEIPERLVTLLIEQALELAGGLHGMEHAMIGIMPYHVLCDRWDIGGLSAVSFPSTRRASVFVYDGCEGGIGLSEKAFHLMDEILTSALELVRDCRCEGGCPSCIHSPKCGNDNRPLDRRATILLLESLCGMLSCHGG